MTTSRKRQRNEAVFETREDSETPRREPDAIEVALLSPQSRFASTDDAPLNEEVNDTIDGSQSDLPESSSILPNDTVRFLLSRDDMSFLDCARLTLGLNGADELGIPR